MQRKYVYSIIHYLLCPFLFLKKNTVLFAYTLLSKILLFVSIFDMFNFQMFSERMAKYIRAFGSPQAQGMATLCDRVDEFFDILNSTPANEVKANHKNKPNLLPFTDVNDPRFQVSSSHE